MGDGPLYGGPVTIDAMALGHLLKVVETLGRELTEDEKWAVTEANRVLDERWQGQRPDRDL